MALTKITGEGVGAVDNLTVDTNTLHVDAANNRVGIGTASPAVNLDIVEDSASTDAILGITAGTGGRAQIRSEAQSDGTSSVLSFHTMSSSNTSEVGRWLAGGGLTFNGDTAAANALDDYEEGSFNPTVVGTSSSGTFTYTQRNGRYVKVGNQVTVQIYLEVSITVAGSGTLRIDDLPFNSHTSVYQALSTTHDTLSGSNAGAAFVQAGGDFIEFTDGNSTSRRGFPGTGTKYIFVGGTYLTQF